MPRLVGDILSYVAQYLDICAVMVAKLLTYLEAASSSLCAFLHYYTTKQPKEMVAKKVPRCHEPEVSLFKKNASFQKPKLPGKSCSSSHRHYSTLTTVKSASGKSDS